MLVPSKLGRALAVLAIVSVALTMLVPAVRAEAAVTVTDLDGERGRGVLPAGAVATLRIPAGADSYGFTWTAGDFAIHTRARSAAGWSHWITLEDEADHGDGHGDADDGRGAGPIWTGPGLDLVEIVVEGSDALGLTVHAIDAGSHDTGDDVVGLVEDGEPLPLAIGAPGSQTVRPHSAWASPGWSYGNCPSGPVHTRPIDTVIVHHTVTATSYGPDEVDDILRSIHRFHTRTRGWCDIAYQFLVDRFGGIWEGRSGGIALPVQGGHARGFNTGTVGVALLGDFHGHGVPDAATRAVGLVAGWKAAANDFEPHGTVRRVSAGSTSIAAGVEVEIPRISGHRHVSSSTCPGRHGFATLPRVRDLAAETSVAPAAFHFGRAGDAPVIGDWNGDGHVGAGLYRDGTFYLSDDLAPGSDVQIRFGLPGDLPVVGDWNGDGADTPGVLRDATFHLLDSNRSPAVVTAVVGDRTIEPLIPDDVPRPLTPLAGDWDGDGVATLGLRGGDQVVLYADEAATEIHERRTVPAGDRVLVLDLGDGVDGIAVVHDGVLTLPDGRPVHALGDRAAAFIDASGRGLQTLLTVDADLLWDPTTPIGR